MVLAVRSITVLSERPKPPTGLFGTAALPSAACGNVMIWRWASERTQSTICAASAGVCCGCGGMGNVPQTPAPPVITFACSFSLAPGSAEYFAATAAYGGPALL